MYCQAEREQKKINFQQICEETSLHGWKFIYFKNSQPCHVAFWILVILSVIALSGIIISDHVIGMYLLSNYTFLKVAENLTLLVINNILFTN